MLTIIGYIILGVFAGSLSGLIGIGGGIILVPALVFLFGLNQHQAQGTTLAILVPPIGIFAALTYYKQGYVDIRIALFICLGFLIGGLLGANVANDMPDAILKKVFSIALLLIAIKTYFS